MKSVKIIFLFSALVGCILFVYGFTLMANIRATPPTSQNRLASSTSSSEATNFSITDSYVHKDPINYLVLIKEASGLNTDSIIIANYNPVTRQISLLTVPRDTRASEGASYKINASYYLGVNKFERSKELTTVEQKQKAVEYAVQSISNLTDINIDYYIYLEIDTIKEIINRVGGVYFDVPADLKYNDPTQNLHINLKKGYQLLNGDKAEQLLRFRKPASFARSSPELKKYYDGSDLKRTEMQIRFINTMIDQKVNIVELPSLIPVIRFGFDNVITNATLSDTLSLLTAFTKGERPPMNTFKLHGVDRTLYNQQFFIYNQNIEDTGSRKVLKAEDIIHQYFTTTGNNFSPIVKYHYNDTFYDNPSNSDSDTKGEKTDLP